MTLRISDALLMLSAGLLLFAAGAGNAFGAEEEPAAAGTPQAPTPAGAEAATPSSTPPTDSAAPAQDFVSTKNIEDSLTEARRTRVALFNFGLRKASRRLEKRLYRATRIRVAGIYTFLYQDASTGLGPRQAGGGDLDIVATWDAIQRRGKTLGALDLALEARHKAWTDIPPSALSNTIDSLWTTVSGFNVQDFAATQLYWRQSLLRGRLRLRVGKISPYSTFFGNRINSSSTFFVNYGFADNPAVFMPGNGFGLHASYDLSPKWTVHAGAQNANGVKTKVVPSTLKLDEFWHAVQVDYHAKFRALGTGTYRLGVWYSPAREVAGTPEGAGAVLSIDQELGKKVIGFLRYEWQGEALLNPEVRFDALTATRSALRFGVGLPGPFKRMPDDFMGVAVARGDPANASVRDSFVGEYFYRFIPRGGK